MMRALDCLRRSVALLICPELAQLHAGGAVQGVPKQKTKFVDLAIALHDAERRADRLTRGRIIPVEVQAEPDGPWHPAKFVDGVLKWVPAPLGKAEAERLAAMRDAIGDANPTARAAIDAALAGSADQFAGAETRHASQLPRGVDPNGADAKLRFRFPQAARTGGLR